MNTDFREGLDMVADLLPGVDLVFYTRAPVGDHRFTWLTGQVEAVFQRPPSELDADPDLWRRILHPSDRDRVPAALSVLAGDPVRDQLHLQYRIVTRNGDIRWLRDDVRIMRNPDGTPAALLGVLRDVSDQWELERKLNSLQERLWESQRMEALGELAGGIAHDFNNLLTAVLTSAQLLEDDPSIGEEAREDLQVIKDATRKGAAMVRQILEFAARSPHSMEAVDVSGVVSDMETILARTLGPGIRLVVESGGELPPVYADAGRLEQVLLNLAVNAREAMKGSGVLEMRADAVRSPEEIPVQSGTLAPGSYVRMTVRDDGPGVPVDVIDQIFEPFFSTKRRSGGGSGVGLATVLRIVRGYGGGIQVETRPGEGAAFHVFLPADRPVEARAVPEAGVARESPEPGGARILVVEDDPRVRTAMERSLHDDGHLVVAVGLAEEALQVFDRVRPPFNLLVTDVALPDRSGPELFRALTRRVDSLPVLYVSGHGREQVLRQGVLEPGVFFLSKPFTSEELRRMVDEVLLTVGLTRSDEPEAGAAGA